MFSQHLTGQTHPYRAGLPLGPASGSGRDVGLHHAGPGRAGWSGSGLLQGLRLIKGLRTRPPYPCPPRMQPWREGRGCREGGQDGGHRDQGGQEGNHRDAPRPKRTRTRTHIRARTCARAHARVRARSRGRRARRYRTALAITHAPAGACPPKTRRSVRGRRGRSPAGGRSRERVGDGRPRVMHRKSRRAGKGAGGWGAGHASTSTESPNVRVLPCAHSHSRHRSASTRARHSQVRCGGVAPC